MHINGPAQFQHVLFKVNLPLRGAVRINCDKTWHLIYDNQRIFTSNYLWSYQNLSLHLNKDLHKVTLPDQPQLIEVLPMPREAR